MADPLDKHYKALNKAHSAGDAEAVEVIRHNIAQEMKAMQAAGATEGMGTTGKVVAGIGHGLVNTAKNVGDLVGQVPGLGFLRPDAEKWQEEREAAAPLMDTTAGQVGNFVGETAATLPVGGLAGAGAKAVAAKVGPKLLKAAAGPMGQAVAAGSASGAVLAGPENRTGGAVVGAALPYGLGKVGGLVRKGYQGFIQPTRPARQLMQEGVDLTMRQMAPHSTIGQLQELASDLPVARQLINAREGAAKKQWQNLVLSEGRAPGAAKLNPAAAIDDRLAASYEGFEPAYEAVKSELIYPAIHAGGKGVPLQSTKNVPGAIARAVNDPGILASTNTRNVIVNWAESQLGLIGGSTRQGAVGKLPAEGVLKMRSNVRKEIAKKVKANDFESAALLEKVETTLTDALESQLPEEAATALRATDAMYRQHKVVSDAVGRAGDSPAGFTPAHLSAAVKRATDDGAYARGAGGRLRKLARAGRETLEPDMPATGVRMLPLMMSLPVTTIAGLAASTQTGTKLLTGTTAGQKALRAIDRNVRRRLLRAGGKDVLNDGSAAAATTINTARGRE